MPFADYFQKNNNEIICKALKS